jgi:hypothetical protein
VSFILIPPELARSLQSDSPFPEVLALNAAARRARGKYIGRIDQDTLVGRRFLEVFFQFYDGSRQLTIPLEQALLYSNRRGIPYWFAVRCPGRQHVTKFIRLLGPRCAVTRVRRRGREFWWTYFVGIWLIHRNNWNECGGYDERFIYYDWMEVEMILRLRQRYTLIDLGEIVDCDFYHLDHQHPRVPKKRRDVVRYNSFDRHNLDPGAVSLPYYPNSDAWGLAEFELEAASGMEASPPPQSWSDNLGFAALVASTGMQLMVDRIYLSLASNGRLWTQRLQKAWAALRGEHPLRWPGVLMGLWAARGRGA